MRWTNKPFEPRIAARKPCLAHGDDARFLLGRPGIARAGKRRPLAENAILHADGAFGSANMKV